MSEERTEDADLKCECDPMTKVIRQFYTEAFGHDSPLWNGVINELSAQKLSQLKVLLVEKCIHQFHTKNLLKHGLLELKREQKQFPNFFIEHFHVKEIICNFWKNEDLSNSSPTEVPIGKLLAEKLVGNISKHLQIENIPENKPNWTAAVFQFNFKDVLQKTVKWSMKHLPLKNSSSTCPIHVSQNPNYKVDIAMKQINSSNTDASVTSKNESEDAPVLMARSITRLLARLKYSLNYENGYTVIPESITFPRSNILVVFEHSDSELLNAHKEAIVMEMDSSVEFHSQFSDTHVILYNYARLKSILEKYNTLVENGEYPKLPEINQVDFSLIGDSKEEAPLVFMLFLWPRILGNTVNLEIAEKYGINLPFLFKFLKTFAKSFDAFYNRVVVIVPQNANHNFQAMMARLYLIKAIFNVFEEFLEIAGIEMEGLSDAENNLKSQS